MAENEGVILESLAGWVTVLLEIVVMRIKTQFHIWQVGRCIHLTGRVDQGLTRFCEGWRLTALMQDPARPRRVRN